MLLLRAMPPVSRSRQSLGAKLVESSGSNSKSNGEKFTLSRFKLSRVTSHKDDGTGREGYSCTFPQIHLHPSSEHFSASRV